MSEYSGLIAALLWGCANVLIGSISRRLDMLSLNALRLVAASPIVLILPVILGSPGFPAQESTGSWLLIMGGTLISILLGDTAYFVSQKTIGVSLAQPIAATYPIITLALGIIFLGESPTWTFALSLALVPVGVWILTRGKAGNHNATDSPGALRKGAIMALFAGTCWAIGIALFQRGLEGMDILVANAVRLPATAVILCGLVAFSGRPIDPRRYGRRTLAVIVIAGMMGMGTATLFFLDSIQMVGGAKTALLASTQPFFAAPLAVIFLKEKLSWQLVVGLLICACAVWLILAPGITG